MPKPYSEEDFARAFTEWDRRLREDPERFQSEATRLLTGTPASHGEACAPYFALILQEVTVVAPPPTPAT